MGSDRATLAVIRTEAWRAKENRCQKETATRPGLIVNERRSCSIGSAIENGRKHWKATLRARRTPNPETTETGLSLVKPIGFNALAEEFEDLVKAGVIDPTKVTRAASQNAASVAGLPLTTEAMISDFHGHDTATAMSRAAGGMDF